MLARQIKLTTHVFKGIRQYAHCCRPRPPPPGVKCGCPPKMPGGKGIQPPPDCSPGPIAPNPCVPRFHHGKDTWKIYRNLTFFVMFPLIIVQAIHVFGHEPEDPGPCRDYEYMRIRTKKYPWGDGVKTFFHNEHINKLPGECEPPLLDCD